MYLDPSMGSTTSGKGFCGNNLLSIDFTFACVFYSVPSKDWNEHIYLKVFSSQNSKNLEVLFQEKTKRMESGPGKQLLCQSQVFHVSEVPQPQDFYLEGVVGSHAF